MPSLNYILVEENKHITIATGTYNSSYNLIAKHNLNMLSNLRFLICLFLKKIL